MDERHYEGIAEVYNKKFYINTKTGVGVQSVLKKIDPLLNKMSHKTYISGCNPEDIKGELTVIAIEGIRAYDDSKNVKLSTFLHVHIRNKLISRLRSENRMSNDATTIESDNETEYRKAKEEVNFGQCEIRFLDGEKELFENSLSNSDSFYNVSIPQQDEVEFSISLAQISSYTDETTAEIIKLIAEYNYSIKEAAEAVGLTGWAASSRLKKLAEKKKFREYFER